MLLRNDGPRYTILAATPAYLAQTGTTREGTMGMGIFEVFPGNPDDPTDTGASALRASLAEVQRQKKPHHLPVQRYDVAGADGSFSRRYWRASNQPVFSEAGEIAYIIHSAEDITEHVRALEMEQQMKELEEVGQDLLNVILQAPIGICVIDAATQVSRIVNDSFVEIAGRPIHEIIGRIYWDTFPEARPVYEEALIRVVSEGITFRATEVELPLLRHGKKEQVNLSFVYEPVKGKGDVVKNVVVWVSDNTPQIIARKKTEESQAKYQRLFNSIDDGFCTIELLFDDAGQAYNYRFLEVNKAFEQQTGLTNAVGFTMNDFARLEDFWYETYGKVAVTGEAVRFEHWAENLHRYYDVYAFKVGAVEERKVAVLFTDITQRKNAERNLQDTADLLQSVFDSAPNGIAVMQPAYDEKGKVTDFAIVLFNAYTHNWIGNINYKGKLYGDLFPMVKQTGILERFIEVAETGHPVNFEKWYVGEGMKHWFRFRAVKQGELLVVTTEDITDRKRAEETIQESKNQLLFAIDATELGVWDYNLAKNIFKANDRFKEWYGLDGEEEIDANAGIAIIAEADRQRVIEAMQKALQWGGGDYDIEYTLVHPKTGRQRIVRAKGKTTFDENKVAQRFNGTLQDVTIQTVARKQIEESEQRLSNIVNQVNAGIAQTTTRGQFTDANDRFCQLTGYTKKELLGQTIKGITHPDDWPRNEALVVRALMEGKNFFIEKRYIRKDGSSVWVNNSVSIVTDSKGERFIAAVSVDITDQIINRQRLEESEERFRSMADASPVMIWTLDEQGNSTYYNNRAAAFTGHNEEELREGKSWQVAIHPDDIEFAAGVVRNAVVNRIPYQMECRMQRADGEWRWLLNHGTPRFGKNGEYFGFVGSSIDITERKSSRQELETALEQMRLSKEAAELGTFDMDLEKGTMHWDDRCRTLFGISHHGTVSYDHDFVGGLHPDDRPHITRVIGQLFNRSVSNGDYDVEYRTVGAEDGVIRWVRAKGKVYFNAQDKPLRFIGSVLDITEKVTAIQRIEALVEERTKELAQANEALQEMNRELQRSNQTLEEFAHAASHDLKEPVRKILYFTNQLKDQLSTQLQESQARALNRIENASQRMGNLIDDLLLYSHVSQRPHEMESVDLNLTVQNAMEDLELDIAEKNAVIHLEKLSVVKGYRRQLQQLFQNLISNAVKYSREDVPPRINISATMVREKEKAYHLISIRDNGIGFPEEYADRIFQMFSRLHGKNEYSGTGVGLSIVKKVVENHGGFIAVQSDVGAGSEFRIYLPV